MLIAFNSDVNFPNQRLMSEAAELIAQYLQRLIALRTELQFETQVRYGDLSKIKSRQRERVQVVFTGQFQDDIGIFR